MTRYERDVYYQAIGEAIRERREKSGLTMIELARQARITPSAVQNAETGATCSVLILDRIATAFDCLIDELVPVGLEEAAS